MSGFGQPPAQQYPPPPSAPPPPQYPPSVPPPPRDGLTAATAAVLNLSGLGLGYLFLRRWRRAIPCWIATAALLFAALPVEPEGIAGIWVVLYGVALVAFALDAWRVGGPPPAPYGPTPAPYGRPPSRPWLPLAAGVLLLALPATSVVCYGSAQNAALEEELEQRLTAADRIVREAEGASFGSAREDYDSALTRYLNVSEDHPDSDAAETLPGRLDDLYEQATESSGDDCADLDALRYFKELPEESGGAQAERLAQRADEDLPAPLHGCGLQRVESGDPDGAADVLTELLEDYPDSEYATGLSAELSDRQSSAVDAIGGEDSCGALDEVGWLAELADQLPGEKEEYAQIADDGLAAEPEGLYQCGTDQFLEGSYADSVSTLRQLVSDYPDNGHVDRAGDIIIAAQIAEEIPAAGDDLPPEEGTTGGGSVTVTIYNDSPYEQEVLYTGPNTAKKTIAACGSCSVYSSDPGESACSADVTYPSITLHLPAGTYHFLHRSVGEDSESPATSTDSLSTAYTYSFCSYSYEDYGYGYDDYDDYGDDES